MNFSPRLVRSLLLMLCAGFVVLPTFAVAQDAKALYDQSLVEGNSCKKMQLSCQAAKLDPKKKDYSDTCARFQTATNRSDETFRVKAIDSLSKGDLPGAARWVNGFVCSAELKNSLLGQIADAQHPSTPAAPAQPTKVDPSPTLLASARSAYQKGDFDGAISAARQVTNPDLKPSADDIIERINSYRSAVSAAKQAEGSRDYAGAINSWRTAQGISGNGPDNPGGNIARLEPLAHPATPTQPATPVQQTPTAPIVAKNNPPPPPQPNKPAAQQVDIGAEVNKLLDEAHKQEAANNLQAAVRAYDGVLRLQATNTVAQTGKAALLAKINSDPAEQAKSLAQAIRDFYSSRYADAEDGLRAYLDAPTAKSKGAAQFYLGATRLYGKILSSSAQKAENAIVSPEVQRPFKEARAAGYKPVEKFVSPVVMRAWRSAQ